ncbi:MAG TPA: KpsF/GutQ family sugar-phosphate isomerase [Phaeodactylibacter sp.]|nr:KpsF/GutQ family sugar-phosphate isomerase [Phaeodactylibacter sp.]
MYSNAYSKIRKIVDIKKLILETALATLRIEQLTLANLQGSIDEDFVLAVERIYEARGRVVVTGIGKSALVGRKLVATLNSTGTPALFMHAADAIHGDLGMIGGDDVVLCLSKSGETPEIKVLTPILKQRGNLLIGMVGNRKSFLGRTADVVLFTPVAREADPNNLAPTASTTAQMAMGDALAMALLKRRGFSARDFALVHPGGTLGKQLYLKVGDLYPENERPRVGPQTNLRETLLEMTSKRLGCTAVVDENEKVLGIITDGDLRRMLEKNAGMEVVAAEMMTPNPKMVTADVLAVKALEMMQRHNITQLIVAKDDGTYLGVLHLHDLIREGLI